MARQAIARLAEVDDTDPEDLDDALQPAATHTGPAAPPTQMAVFTRTGASMPADDLSKDSAA